MTLCSDSPFHCKHLNRTVNSDYIQKVMKDGGDKATGIIRGLYDDVRYLVARPITYDNATYGIAIVSSPTASTNAVMKKLTTYYLNRFGGDSDCHRCRAGAGRYIQPPPV